MCRSAHLLLLLMPLLSMPPLSFPLFLWWLPFEDLLYLCRWVTLCWVEKQNDKGISLVVPFEVVVVSSSAVSVAVVVISLAVRHPVSFWVYPTQIPASLSPSYTAFFYLHRHTAVPFLWCFGPPWAAHSTDRQACRHTYRHWPNIKRTH